MRTLNFVWTAGRVRLPIAGWLLFSLAITGCSGTSDPLGRKAVQGKVSFDGQPLASGSISFQPINLGNSTKQTSSGGVITSGKYALDAQQGLPPGKYTVSISASAPTTDFSKLSPDEQMQAASNSKPVEQPIPAKYNSKTELIAEVSADKANVIDFDLKSKP